MLSANAGAARVFTLTDVPDSADPFALLGLPVRVDLSADEILSAFRQRARKAHPDSNQSASAASGDTHQYHQLVQARTTLLDLPARISAAFAYGLDLKLNAEKPLSPELLETFFERFAEVEQVAAASDSSEKNAQADRLKTALTAEASQLLEDAGEAFGEGDSDRAEDALAKHRYVQRMLQLLEPRQNEKVSKNERSGGDRSQGASSAPPGMKLVR